MSVNFGWWIFQLLLGLVGVILSAKNKNLVLCWLFFMLFVTNYLSWIVYNLSKK